MCQALPRPIFLISFFTVSVLIKMCTVNKKGENTEKEEVKKKTGILVATVDIYVLKALNQSTDV